MVKTASAPILSAPKVLLHDHLDGGMRPASVIELAREQGYNDLPTQDPDDLAQWFTRGADRRNLVLYLETFAHTVGVTQTKDRSEPSGREAAARPRRRRGGLRRDPFRSRATHRAGSDPR